LEVVFDALWSAIAPRTKANLTYQLGQLVQAIDNAWDEEIRTEFEFIEFVFKPCCSSSSIERGTL
jgi:hypothetical protein